MSYIDRFWSIIHPVRNRAQGNNGPAQLIKQGLEEEYIFWKERHERTNDTKEREVLRNRLTVLEKAIAKPDQYLIKENPHWGKKSP